MWTVDQGEVEGGVQLVQLHGRPHQDRVHPPLTGSHSGRGSGHGDDWAGGWQVDLLQELPGYNWSGIGHLFQRWGGHLFLCRQFSLLSLLSQQLSQLFLQLQLLVQLHGEGDVSAVRVHDGGGGEEVQLLQQGDRGQV